MESFGSYLKTHREKKGIRLEEIASITKIHVHALSMLEASKWKELPPEPFIRGFIIAYAKYIGLDVKETIGKYLDEVGHKAPEAIPTPAAEPTHRPAPPMRPTQPSQPGQAPQSQPSTPSLLSNPSQIMENVRAISSRNLLMGAGAVGALAIIVLIISIGKNSSQNAEPSPVAVATEAPAAVEQANAVAIAAETGKENRLVASPSHKAEKAKPEPEKVVAKATPAPTASPVPAPTATVAAAEKPADTATPAAATPPSDAEVKHTVVIEGKERSWIKIVVDDAAPIEYFLPEGQKAEYKARQKIKVVLGNATGSKVTHNGEVAEGKQFEGTIRFYIFPRGSRFPQDVPSKRAPSSTVIESDSAG